MITKGQYHLIAELLDMADEEFGNHRCNDYELPNTPENRTFLEAAELWNARGDKEHAYPLNISADEKTIYTRDYFLMAYCAHLAHVEAGDTEERSAVVKF